MSHHRSYRRAATLLLLAILASWLPGAAPVSWSPGTAQVASAAATTPIEPPRDVARPTLVTPAADTTPSRPVLAIALATADDTVAVGDTTTISITVTNRGVVPATAVSLNLPIPDGIQIVPGGEIKPGQPIVTWDLGTLDAQASATRSLTVRATGAAKGDTVLFQPQASATDAVTTATAAGGFVVVSRGLGAAQAAYTPGTSTTLKSLDGRVSLQVPPGLFRRGLTLRHRNLVDAIDDLKAHGRPVPPRYVGAHRAFPTFVLEATDSLGADIHQFDAPLTLTVAYTPEQLQTLGIREQDLQLYWFDETAQTWQALPTTVDAASHTVSAQLNHFTTLTLSDGSSPSAAYLPSLQNWQVSQFTGAASYRYPIEVPAGPGGLAPQLSLNYSSAASQGSGGTRPTWQAGWAGKGWDLDGVGYIATNENTGQSDHKWDSYTMVFGGQSSTLVKGKRVDGVANATTYGDYALDKWNWHATDENYTRVTAIPAAGGVYGWRAWSKDGTRYEFDTALRWGETQGPTFWTYKWLLTKIVDTHGNVIRFDYVVPNPIFNGQTIHPLYYLSAIHWAFDGTGTPRYRIVFGVADRQTGTTAGVDANWEYSNARVSGQSGTPHEQYRLDDITVQSWPVGAPDFQTIRNYHLTYASTATSVQTDATAGQKVLTLLNIEQRDQNNQTIANAGAASPEPFKTSFTYGMTQGNAVTPITDWNKLATIDNGRGGKLWFTYDRVWQSGATPNNADSYTAYYQNYYRVTEVLAQDLSGTGKQTLTAYDYGAAGNAGINDEARAATVLYAKYPPTGQADSTQYLSQAPRKEFRGHATVIERHYDGATASAPLLQEVQQWFYQGNSSSAGDPGTTCSPLSGTTLNASSTCFTWMKQFEGLKGRVYKEETRKGAIVLARTLHTFARFDLPFYGSDTDAQFSNYYQRAGVWRAFSPEIKTEAQAVENSGSPVTKTTLTYFNTSCTADTTTTVTASYGNPGCILEQAGTATVRKTRRWYTSRNDSAGYIVDRMWQEATSDVNEYLLALTNNFYDGISSGNATPTIGELKRSTRYYDIPANTSNTTGMTLHGSDTTFGYDGYGNPNSSATYTAASTRLYNGSTTSWSAVSGSARTTSTIYDTRFNAFPTQVTNPLNQSTTGTYDYRMGTLASVTDANNATTSAYYDTYGRMIAIVKPGDSTTWPTMQAYYYDTERPFRYRVRQLGLTGQENYRETQQFYDGLGRKIQTKAQSSDGSANLITIVADMRYDGLGRMVGQSQPRYVTETGTSFFLSTAIASPLFNPMTTSYDALGRPIRITQPNGAWTEHLYGLTAGLRFDDVVDPNRHRVQRRTDALGRLQQVVEVNGDCGTSTYSWASCVAPYTTSWVAVATTNYSYDALDQLRTVSDAAPTSNVTTIWYDSLGRKTSMSDPDMGGWSYGYDPNGNLTSQTSAKGQTITFAYDNLDRLKTKTASDGWVSTYAYDDTTAPNKGKGHRTSMWTELNGTSQTYKRWEYDARGRTTLIGQNPAGVTTDLGYTYDSGDRIASTIYYEAGETTYPTYDAGWRPITLCTTLPSEPCYVTNAKYTALDQPDTRTTANGVLQDWGYDATTARLGSLKVSKSAATFFQRNYAYDNADNVTGISDPNPSSPQTQHFTYDNRDRLTHAWTTATTAFAPAMGPALAKAPAATPAFPAETADLGALVEQQGNPVPIAQQPVGSGRPLFRPVAGVTAQTGTRIKDITFESGSLTDATNGADSTTPTVNVETSAPIKGSTSARIPNDITGGYLAETFTGVNELFVSFYIRPASFPASARILQIRNGSTTVGEIALTNSGTLQLKNTGSTIGTSTALSANSVYRIGIRQKAGAAGTAVLQAFLASGDAAFSATPFASNTTTIAISGTASEIRFGRTNSPNLVDATFDDIKLDSATMPGPSGGGVTPTNTPTNTPVPTPINTPVATPTNTPVATATPVPTAPPAYDISMGYDAIGNLTSKTGVGVYGYGVNGNGTGAGPHQVRNIGGNAYTYDANGNMVTGNGWTYTWNADNTLANMTNGSTSEYYAYDGDGERVVKGTGGVNTVYFEGLWEQTTTGARKLYYTFNGQVVAMRDSAAGNAVTYLHGDHLGSISVATWTDANNTVQSSTQEFDPWGQVRSGGVGATSLGYTGQRLDATGLLYYHARYYNPYLARFISADSVVPGNVSGGMDGVALKGLTVDFHEPGFVAQLGGENNQPFWFQMSGKQRQQAGRPWGPANPQSLNRYSYVQNNPLRYTDPSGHVYCTECDRNGGGGGSSAGCTCGGGGWAGGGSHWEAPVEAEVAEAEVAEAEVAEAEAAEAEAANNPIEDYVNDSTPGRVGKSAQYSRTGGFDQANADFDKLAGSYPVKTYPGGIRSVELPNGTTVSVRPTSSGNYPTIQINTPGVKPIKVRYEP